MSHASDVARVLAMDVHAPADRYDSNDALQLACRLRAELLELDVQSARLACGDASAGGADADFVTFSRLLVTFTPASGVLMTIIGTVRDWLWQQPARGVVVDVSVGGDTLRIEGAATAERLRLVDAFVAWHGHGERSEPSQGCE
jgi:hypothetical protein